MRADIAEEPAVAGLAVNDDRVAALGLVATQPGVDEEEVGAPARQRCGVLRRRTQRRIGAECQVARHSLSRLTRPGGVADASPFGEDLDHAGGCFRAVQRCRGRPLDDLDPLDVLRIDAVERAGHIVVAPPRVPDRRHVLGEARAANPHPVDVDQGLVGLGHRDVAAKADHGSAPHAGRTLRNGHARHARLKQRIHICRRRHHVLLHVEQGDRVADFTPSRGPGRSGHHDLVETQCLGRQREVLLESASRHRDLRVRRGVPDALGAQGIVTRRHVQDDEAAIVTGQRSEAGTDQEHLHRAHGPLARGIRDRTGDRAVLRADRRRHCQRHREEHCRRPGHPAPKGTDCSEQTVCHAVSPSRPD